jgi:hypothetical protein
MHQFQNVPSKIHTDLMIASSVEIFYTEKIRNRFRSVCIDKPAAKKKFFCLEKSSKKI